MSGMKVMVVDSGGRGHALAWKILCDIDVSCVYITSENYGVLKESRVLRVPIQPYEINKLCDFALKREIDFTVSGSEAQLCDGIVDRFEEAGLKIFGPNMKAAEIEGSKIFAKEFMWKYGIPTAAGRVFNDKFGRYNKAISYIHEHGAPIVVKADGRCGGKGASVCETIEEAVDFTNKLMLKRIHGKAGESIIIEDRLEGEEVSYQVFTDGETILPMLSAQDHKRVFDNDQGDNTGGMGAYAPAPIVTKEVEKKILERIIVPTLGAMEKEGRPYKGVLYAGLMIDKNGDPWVLEFNCRFGDPETQSLIVLMSSGIMPILMSCTDGTLHKQRRIIWGNESAVCVVMAARGYPGAPQLWDKISGLDIADSMEDIGIFHAGTAMLSPGEIVTNGGRVVGVTGLGNNMEEAIRKTYEAVQKITWSGVHYRKDIGQKALKWLKK